MPLPTASDVHVNAPLTNISIAYIQAASNFAADKVFPIVPVNKQSDRYFAYDRADFFRIEAIERAPSTESVGGGFRIDNTPTYFSRVYAVHKDIDDQIRANADAPINMDRDATTYVTQQLLLRREKIWVNNYFTTGKWGLDLTGVAAAPGANQFLQWDQAASSPIEDITAQSIRIAEATGYKPNVLVLGPRVFNILRNHADIIDRIKYTQRGVVTTEIMASVFDVDRVVVPFGTENTAAEGLTGTFNYMYGKSALLTYANPTPSLLQPSGGYIFTWTGLLGAGAYGNRIKRFRMEQLSSDRVEGELAFDAKLVASELGTFFASAVV